MCAKHPQVAVTPHTHCWQTFTEVSEKNRNALTSPAPLNLSQMMSVAL